MAIGCGIDVGEHAFYPVRLDTVRRTIRWPPAPLALEGTVAWVRDAAPERIAVDSPPGPHRGVLASAAFHSRHSGHLGQGSTNRRVAEWRLGIGGCYATPGSEEAAPGWMQAGMQLFRALAHAGYAVNLGRSDAPVLEVHPTYGFRSLLSLDTSGGRIRCDRQRMLRPKLPVGSIGHRQRIALLNGLLARWNMALDAPSLQRVRGSLDWMDALLAACLAVLQLEGLTFVAGDDEGVEGGIHLSRVRVPLPAELEAIPSPPTPQRRARPCPEDEGSGMLLRLGDEGLGCFTQTESLERVLDQFETEGAALVPLGVKRIAEATKLRASETNLVVLLAHAGIVRLELEVNALHGQGAQLPIRSNDVWGDREDIWEGNVAPYWAVASAVRSLHLPAEELLFRHGGAWRPGFTRSQSAWLHFRYPDKQQWLHAAPSEQLLKR